MSEPQGERMLGKYRLDERLGEGGMGVVYAAFDTVLKRRVAIKLLPEATAGDAVALQRFVLEAQAAARLNHPNAVAVYEVARRGDTYYIAMEFVGGGNVAERLAGGSLPYREATRIAADVCRALVAAHAAGLIHRDVKPANFMLSTDGRVKLADFGLSKAVDRRGQSLTGAASVCGTPAFMSPEQCRSDEIDSSSDLYSLGASYFAMLTGRAPYEAEQAVQVMFAHCTNSVPDPRQINPATPAACAAIVQRAMAKQAADRFANAAAMLAALEEILEDNGPQPPPVSPPVTHRAAASPPALNSPTVRLAMTQTAPAIRERSLRRRRQQTRVSPWFLSGGVAAVVCVAGLAVYFFANPPTDRAATGAAARARRATTAGGSAARSQPPAFSTDRSSESGTAAEPLFSNAVNAAPVNPAREAAAEGSFLDRVTADGTSIVLKLPVSALAMAPHGLRLIAGELGDQGRLVEIDLNSGRVVQELDLSTLGPNAELRGNGTQHGILATALSPDGKLMLVGGSGRCFGTWLFSRDDQRRWRLDRKLSPASARSLTFDSSGDLFAASLTLIPSDFPSLRVWDSIFLTFVDPAESPAPRVRAVAFSPAEKRLLLAADERGDVVSYALTGSPARVVQRYSTGLTIESLAVSPDGKRLAAVGQGRLQLWRLDRPERYEFEVATTAHDVIFTRDGERLITAGGRQWERDVGIWQTDGLQWQRALTGHHERVQRLALSAQGDILASGSVDRTVRLWRLEP